MNLLRSVAVTGLLTAGFGLAHAETAGFTLSGPPKIAIIEFGPKQDGGWTQSFEEARKQLEASLGVKIAAVNSVPEDPVRIKAAADRFISGGYNIIIGTAFGYSDAFKQLAEAHPKVAFLNGSGTTNGANLESFYGRSYEGHYLCGMVAGAMSKTGHLGFVAAHPFGVVNWTVNAYEMGAKLMNPKATTTVIYTGSWNDPVKERAATEALIDGGADVIGQHVDTPTPQIVAQERGVYATGHHRDLSEFAPKATLCSSIWTWSKFLGPEIKKIEAGNWHPSPYGAFPGMPQGGDDVACCGAAVPADVKAKVMAERAAILNGKHVYAGPLVDRTGKTQVAAGATLSDADLWKMDWYVPGVVTQQ